MLIFTKLLWIAVTKPGKKIELKWVPNAYIDKTAVFWACNAYSDRV